MKERGHRPVENPKDRHVVVAAAGEAERPNQRALLPRTQDVTESPLGLQSTAVVIVVVFASTGYFFWETVVWTVQQSLKTKGAIGRVSRCCSHQAPCLCKRKKKRRPARFWVYYNNWTQNR